MTDNDNIRLDQISEDLEAQGQTLTMLKIQLGPNHSVQLSKEEAKTLAHEIAFIQGLDLERDRGIIQLADSLAEIFDFKLRLL